MALSTTDLKDGGGGLPKTITPGNYSLKINNMVLEDFKFIQDAKHIILNVETEPIEGFEGFMIDKNDPELGHHTGQVGRVKGSQFAYADGVTKTGIKIQRDRSVLIFLQNLCKALEINDWFLEQNDKHDTIEEFILAFNETAPFRDKYFDACVAGKEYEGKSGYTNYDMWFPKASKDGYAYATKGGKVLKYNEVIHLVKMEVKPVENFGDDEDLSIPNKVGSDFDL